MKTIVGVLYIQALVGEVVMGVMVQMVEEVAIERGASCDGGGGRGGGGGVVVTWATCLATG